MDKAGFDFKNDLPTESACFCFSRNFELAKLQYKHLVENAYADDGYHHKHLLVTLENRKGRQGKLSKEADLWGLSSFHEQY